MPIYGIAKALAGGPNLQSVTLVFVLVIGRPLWPCIMHWATALHWSELRFEFSRSISVFIAIAYVQSFWASISGTFYLVPECSCVAAWIGGIKSISSTGRDLAISRLTGVSMHLVLHCRPAVCLTGLDHLDSLWALTIEAPGRRLCNFLDCSCIGAGLKAPARGDLNCEFEFGM